MATLIGTIPNPTPLDPIKALLESAAINRVAAVPIMLIVNRHSKAPYRR
jgi:hypothetical protein